jgi:hypothetical protein
MACEAFIEKNFQKSTMAVIEQANVIIGDYAARGFALTLRQLYYQFVARGLIEENSQREYKRIGTIVNNARQAGLIDWDAIEDRTRNLQSFSAWSDPAEFLVTVAESYREDPWSNQAYRPEVWIEKDALLGVIEDVCRRWRAPFFACRGNNSQSEQYAAGKRFAERGDLGFIPIVLHLGDHDPNGLDMTRDNRDRLGMFAGGKVEVRRLALNIDQVRQYRPPPNFAKETDTRFAGYEREFGTQCWELDALDPDVISGLVDREIQSLVDMETWNASIARERDQRAVFAALSENWDDVRELLGSF